MYFSRTWRRCRTSDLNRDGGGALPRACAGGLPKVWLGWSCDEALTVVCPASGAFCVALGVSEAWVGAVGEDESGLCGCSALSASSVEIEC